MLSIVDQSGFFNVRKAHITIKEIIVYYCCHQNGDGPDIRLRRKFEEAITVQEQLQYDL